MVDESIDHIKMIFSLALSRARLSTTEIKPIPLVFFHVIVKNKSTTFFHGLHSYNHRNDAIKC